MDANELRIDASKLLKGMYLDDYYPVDLVDQVRTIILDACYAIETQRPASLPELYEITCAATERINDLQSAFEAADSEIETVARDEIGIAFAYVAEFYGYADADIEALIATRDW